MRALLLVSSVLWLDASAAAVEPPTLPHDHDANHRGHLHVDPSSPLVAKGIPISALADEEAHIDWIFARETDHVALGGLDPVSFFAGDAPKRGASEFEASYRGAHFFFASEANRSQFLADPDRFAPAYGGYDPEGVAMGLLIKPADDQWTIHEGRLYFSSSPELRAEFEHHRSEVIKAADEKWKVADELFERRHYRIDPR